MENIAISEILHTSASQPTVTQPVLRQAVQQIIQDYLEQFGDFPPANIYNMVVAEVETPLLQVMMNFVNNNQSKAAIMLGISRGTLRKKLKQYALDN